MSRNKTALTGASVIEFLQAVEPERKLVEAQELDRLFRKATGYQPQMWGPSIVGYGRYHYRYATGREGEFLATGFTPRRARHSIYIMPGYQDYSAILARLGKHRLGKSCLYVNKLADIDLNVLAELIRAGIKDLNAIWPVQPE
ncbi:MULTISPECIES: DUF1801 domain-containing protein [unclassified Leisingera]|uniref:DUF1801 domain-containing protein n=1 Tax=unclassified Leisingera TaxID=2614906 RepID=UPI000312FC8F|nr:MULTISPECIES: DUF1801 domain-containing protein [unclassified Leisingera]KIC22290.1 hypothetical protein RA23_19355 [Leisingera sp. ANG-S3]KIC53525.1 hypothetical protein RA22_09670 [Leisingera sp. ANG-S]KID07921.1 hypothetical protein GC1_18115 [Leisingera sp. ANG1]